MHTIMRYWCLFTVIALSNLLLFVETHAAAAVVIPGADVLVQTQYSALIGRKVGVIANPTTILQNYTHLVDAMFDNGVVDLVAVFGPEHGFRGDQQAGQPFPADFYIDPRTELRVYNTYGRNSSELQRLIGLSGVDTLVFDIQDVGTRFYTFVWTMWDMMLAAALIKVPHFIVLDRPNPLGGMLMEGPILDPHYSSFIGRLPIPLVHGLTVAELALYFDVHYLGTLPLDLEVVPCVGWKRTMRFDDTGLIWVPPSPNMPTLDTALVYPGLGLLEGSSLSTGRGTTRPFETFGQPTFNWTFVNALQALSLPGTAFREMYYIPTFDRYTNTICGGAQIYVTDVSSFSPLRAGLNVLATAMRLYPHDVHLLDSSFDLHMGNNQTRLDLLAGKSVEDIMAGWQEGIKNFSTTARTYMLYHDY